MLSDCSAGDGRCFGFDKSDDGLTRAESKPKPPTLRNVLLSMKDKANMDFFISIIAKE